MGGGRTLSLAIVMAALAILLLVGGVSASTPINSCTTISSPGTYMLNQNIINSSASTCIAIISSDVVFDGAGYTIDGVDAVSTFGVYVYIQNIHFTRHHTASHHHYISNKWTESHNIHDNHKWNGFG